MTLKEKFKVATLQTKHHILCDRIYVIANMIGDESIDKFPDIKQTLLKWSERVYELEIELYGIYINSHEIDRARFMLTAQENVEKALYLLKA